MKEEKKSFEFLAGITLDFFKKENLSYELKVELNQDDLKVYIPKNESFSSYLLLRWLDSGRHPILVVEREDGSFDEFEKTD